MASFSYVRTTILFCSILIYYNLGTPPSKKLSPYNGPDKQDPTSLPPFCHLTKCWSSLNYFQHKTWAHYQQPPSCISLQDLWPSSQMSHFFSFSTNTLRTNLLSEPPDSSIHSLWELCSTLHLDLACHTSPISQSSVLMDCLCLWRSKSTNRTLVCSALQKSQAAWSKWNKHRMIKCFKAAQSSSRLQDLFCHSNTVNKWKIGWSFLAR